MPSLARDIVERCGRNAFALTLAGANLSSSAASYEELLAALATAKLEFMRTELIGYEYESVMRAIQAGDAQRHVLLSAIVSVPSANETVLQSNSR